MEKALHDFGLTRGKAFSLMATIASEVDDFNSIDYIFDKIRSKTFDLGLRLGVQNPKRRSPTSSGMPILRTWRTNEVLFANWISLSLKV